MLSIFLARLVSVIFHPLFVPLYAVLYLFAGNPFLFGSEIGFAVRTIILNCIFFPLIAVLLMKALGIIESLELPSRQDRILAYIPVCVCLIWACTVLYKEAHIEALSDVMIGVCIALSIAFVVNSVYAKISMHTLGMGGLVAIALFSTQNIAIADTSYWLMAIILLAGMVGTARLLLKAHTLPEIYYGYFFGFMSCAFPLIF